MISFNQESLLLFNLFLSFCVIIINFMIIIISLYYVYTKKEILEDTEKRNIKIWSYYLIILMIAITINILWRHFISPSEILIINIFERISNSLIYLACLVKITDIEKSMKEM